MKKFLGFFIFFVGLIVKIITTNDPNVFWYGLLAALLLWYGLDLFIQSKINDSQKALDEKIDQLSREIKTRNNSDEISNWDD